MRWEDATRKSKTGWAIRYKADKRPTIVNLDREYFSDTGEGLVQVESKPLGKFADWEPISQKMLDKLQLKPKEEHTEKGLAIIDGLKQFSDAIEAKGLEATLGELGLVGNVSIVARVRERFPEVEIARDRAISSLATMVATMANKDELEYARMGMDLLANYLAE